MDYIDVYFLLKLIEAWFLLLPIIIIMSIFTYCGKFILFKKAGKHGWEAFIPFYNKWVLVEIAGLNWWWFLLMIVDSVVVLFKIDGLSTIADFVSLFASFNCYYNVAKKFNKSTGTSVFAGIFSFIFILIFGFSKNEVYNVNIPVSKNGVFGTPEGNNNGYTNNSYQSSSMNQSTNTVDTSNVNANNVEQNSVNQENSFCGNCGTRLNKDVRFCPNCGKEKL